MQKRYEAGDMTLVYELGNVPSWMIVPTVLKDKVTEKNCAPEPLVQLKLVGDTYSGRFLHGSSMKYSGSLDEISFVEQNTATNHGIQTIETLLKDRHGHTLRHIAKIDGVTLRVSTVFENSTNEEAVLEMLSSFTLGGLTPFDAGEATGSMTLHRMQSFWSAEGKLESRPVEEYGLEPSWSNGGGRVLRYGQVGSMPVRGYFPFAAVEDVERSVLWGVQLATASSWQIEVNRNDAALTLSGGIADREFGHWMKKVAPGEAFETPEAILSVCAGDIDELCARLVTAQENVLGSDGETLPVIFNEYCTTWGDPSVTNIRRIAEKLDGMGVTDFVIDCGWYKPDVGDWYSAIGDWEYSRKLFPNGIREAADIIREHGMTPGLWFEMENVGNSAEAFHNTEHLLKRDGLPITVGNRRFWDMQDNWVQDYLTKKVIGTLKEGGFGYLKVDYNDNIGMGCDGAESLGEALRQKVLASQQFFRKIRESVPGITIENCASGGHRLEPSMMQLCDMASFSDAHECQSIPVIAANVQRAIPAWKSQIWAVLRASDSFKRLYYSLANTFLGRMCLSGDIYDLSEEQWQVITDSIAFYKRVSPVLRFGKSVRFGPEIRSYNRLEGWQAVARTYENQTLLVVHCFGTPAENIELPLAGQKLSGFFGEHPEKVSVTEEGVVIRNAEEFSACVMILERR